MILMTYLTANMQNIETLLAQNNVDGLIEEIIKSQNLSYAQVDQLLNDKKYTLVSDHLDLVIDRIYKAKVLNEKVVIVGDYDADGIMATTILYKALSDFGIDVGFYIPNRFSEGYGINPNIVNLVADKGYSLIITVDNGVVAFDALDRAKELGIDLIVTDHHMLSDDNDYDFDYILHPKYLSEGYKVLAGAGIALIIAERIISKELLGEMYVYAMIATIADMVSVFGFNRNIIKNGLFYLNKHSNPYIASLINYQNGPIDQTTISFQVVPKLNTFGRLADRVNVNNMVRYFLLSDKSEIENVAKEINSLNQERIKLTNDASGQALNVKKYGTINILVDESIHEGITGLVAGKILNELGEPILVLTKVNGLYKGSGRAPKGYDIHAVLNPLSEYFESFGGHAQACGISILEDNLQQVLALITEQSSEIVYQCFKQDFIQIDLDKLSVDTVKQVSSLEPFGVDFLKPLFKIDLENLSTPSVLKEKYLKWSLRSDVELLCFDQSLDLPKFKNLSSMQACVNLGLNTFRDKTTINLVMDYKNTIA